MIFKSYELRYIRSVSPEIDGDSDGHVYFPAENVKLNGHKALYVYSENLKSITADPDETLTQTLFDDTPRHVHKWNL